MIEVVYFLAELFLLFSAASLDYLRLLDLLNILFTIILRALLGDQEYAKMEKTLLLSLNFFSDMLCSPCGWYCSVLSAGDIHPPPQGGQRSNDVVWSGHSSRDGCLFADHGTVGEYWRDIYASRPMQAVFNLISTNSLKLSQVYTIVLGIQLLDL